MRLDDRVCLGEFAVEQGLRQGGVLGPLLFHVFFAAVIYVASMRFKTDKGIMDDLVHQRKKKGAEGVGGGNCRRVSHGEASLGRALCRRYRGCLTITRAAGEDDGVITVVCAAFGLTVSRPRLRLWVYVRRGCRSLPPYLT